MATDLDSYKMTIWEHLEELRWILFKCFAAIAVMSIVSFTLVDRFFELLQWPLASLAGKVELIYSAPMDAFMIKFKVALLVGVVLALPAILYFIWSFIAPGLRERERRLVWRVIGGGMLFFLCGAGFGFGLLFFTLPVLVTFGDPHVRQLWSLREYIDFSFQLILGTGLVFEFPVIILLLVRLGLLSVATLRKGRPYAIVGIFILSAVVTPTTDVVTQCFLGVPLVLLYELTILMAAWQNRRRESDTPETLERETKSNE